MVENKSWERVYRTVFLFSVQNLIPAITYGSMQYTLFTITIHMRHYQYVYIFQTCLGITITMHLKTVLLVEVTTTTTTAALFPLVVARCHKVALLFQLHRIPQVCLVLMYQNFMTVQHLRQHRILFNYLFSKTDVSHQ